MVVFMKPWRSSENRCGCLCSSRAINNISRYESIESYELNDLCSGARICIQVSRGNGCMIYVYTISPDRISSVHGVLGEGIEFC